MPKIQNTIPGEWSIGECWLKTGDKVANLNQSLLEVNILQDIYDPFETGIFFISNDAAVDVTLPIIQGTEMHFSYVLNGIKFRRDFKVTAMDFFTSGDKSKGVQITGVTKEFYDIAMNKQSIAYKNLTPADMLKRNGIKTLFQSDTVEPLTWIIPQGKHRLGFISTILPYLGSNSKRKRSRLLRTKEGYSIANFDTLTEKMKEHYEVPGYKALNLYYKNDKVLGRKIEHPEAGEVTPLEQMFQVDEIHPVEARSYSKAIKHKEFSYLIDTFDPMRKLYSVYQYKQNDNTNYGSTLYLEDDVNKIPNRYYKTTSSSTEIGKTFRYPSIQGPYILNRSGFSSQNAFSVKMQSNVLCEVGMKYEIELGADLMNNDTEQLRDPIYSGVKYCIQTRHVFMPERTAHVYMTLAQEGGIPDKKYHEESKLSKG